MPRPVPADKTTQVKERFMIWEFPRATTRSEAARAVALHRLAYLGVDVVGMAAARQPPFALTGLLRKPRVRIGTSR
jgi:hypothetical protein